MSRYNPDDEEANKTLTLTLPKQSNDSLTPLEQKQLYEREREKNQATLNKAKRAWDNFYKTTPGKVDPDTKKSGGGLLVPREGYATGDMVEETMEMPVEQDMPVDTYPNIPPEEMAAAQASQLPDENMEDDYIDFILDESLEEEEQMYLMNALEADPQLSQIFDKVIGVASEFSGAGEVEGPGTGVSDSIPARLSDGEFVMTRKATDAIGPENLQGMMDEAERAYDYDGGLRLQKAFGGVIDDKLEDEKSASQYSSQTDEEIRKLMIGANKMPSVR